ncbi:hypothetical protein OB947_20980 [Aeromonas bestiarum]|uniref:hypothetical protein n=1 Tax=Aeromonas bestiarum TaxID=105751 RepID=UPI00259D5D71|nr:hypothetical protein [Aeromonas bestiarum]MDM5091351.1 hypothetical protein [Aeromonas bestiarum]
MQLASLEEDYWQLRNGEVSHRNNEDTFWIPTLDARKSLKIGDAAKVILDIEVKNSNGEIHVESERSYVIVSELVSDKFIGILDFQPSCIAPDEADVYLGFGVEISFAAEHVIDIDRPPQEYIDWQLGQKPEGTWSRN